MITETACPLILVIVSSVNNPAAQGLMWFAVTGNEDDETWRRNRRVKRNRNRSVDGLCWRRGNEK
jgi:hypothetical protein